MRNSTMLLGVLFISIGLLGCQKTEPVEVQAEAKPTAPPVAHVPEAVALVRVSAIQADGKLASARDFERYRLVQTQLLTSPFVINAALRTLHASDLEILRGRDKPLDWLMKQIKVQTDSEIVRISMRGEREDEIVQVVQAVVEAYLEEIANTEREERSRKLQRVREHQRLRMNEIKEKTAKIKDLSKKLDVAPDRKGGVTGHRRIHELDLAHERIKRLSLRLDDLILEKTTAEARNDKKELERIVTQTKAVEELLQNARAGYQQHLDQLDSGFTADLEMRVFEVEQLKQQLADVMSEVGTLERHLADSPRVTMVQPAMIVEVEDNAEESNAEESQSERDESEERKSDQRLTSA